MSKRIVILQLARLGDILQTLPAIQGIKKSNPESEITLVVRETFADAANLSPFVDHIIEFSAKTILGPFITAGTAESKYQSLRLLQQWLIDSKLVTGCFDLLLNLTFSESSAYLTSLIPAKEKRGMQRILDKRGISNLHIEDLWSQYFCSQVLGQNLNVIHVTDLLARIARVEKNNWPVELRKSASQDFLPINGKRFIGVQVSSSKPEKTLSIEFWTKLSAQIVAKVPNSMLVFFGGPKDLQAITDITKNLPKESVCILASKTKFDENLEPLKKCELLVSPDTALIHFASFIGTKVINLSVGPVRAEETGPYGEGHHILLGDKIEHQVLINAVLELVTGSPKVQSPVPHATTHSAKCTSGPFRSEVVPENYRIDPIKNFFEKAYYLLAEFRCSGRQEDISIPKLVADKSAQGLQDLSDRLLKVHDALTATRKLAQFGQNYCLKMLEDPNNRKLLSENMERLIEIESLLVTLQKNVPFIRPLVDTWKISKDTSSHPNQDDLRSLIALTEGAYRELGQNVDILLQLLQVAVDSAYAQVNKVVQTPEAPSRAKSEETL